MRSMHKTKKTTTTIKIEAISQNGWKLSMWVTGNQKKKEMMENVKIGYLLNCIGSSQHGTEFRPDTLITELLGHFLW